MTPTPQACAREVLDVIPLTMRALVSHLRAGRPVSLSVPQFRTLRYLDHHRGASLSHVAEHLGLTLPSMSRIVDGLVVRGEVTRTTHSVDRRRMTLGVTPRGRASLRLVDDAAQAYLAEMLSALSAGQRATVVSAMKALRAVFARVRTTPGERSGARPTSGARPSRGARTHRRARRRQAG